MALREIRFLSSNDRDQIHAWIYSPATTPKGIVQASWRSPAPAATRSSATSAGRQLRVQAAATASAATAASKPPTPNTPNTGTNPASGLGGLWL